MKVSANRRIAAQQAQDCMTILARLARKSNTDPAPFRGAARSMLGMSEGGFLSRYEVNSYQEHFARLAATETSAKRATLYRQARNVCKALADTPNNPALCYALAFDAVERATEAIQPASAQMLLRVLEKKTAARFI